MWMVVGNPEHKERIQPHVWLENHGKPNFLSWIQNVDWLDLGFHSHHLQNALWSASWREKWEVSPRAQSVYLHSHTVCTFQRFCLGCVAEDEGEAGEDGYTDVYLVQKGMTLSFNFLRIL